MDKYDVYKDIHIRTGGELYIGVVGPVRTGKSTFIKKFMDLMVLPQMLDVHSKERAIDELPQSADGKTIMTTEPKFVPKEAAEISLGNDKKGKVRLIDCVGFMVDGAVGHMEENTERYVKTPWSDEAIPFTKAAEIGTRKVIREHSNIGIIITTDGSFTELSRSAYVAAEEKTVSECKQIGKPVVMLLNSATPAAVETRELAKELSEKYAISVLTCDCQNLNKEDINRIMETVLSDFPISRIEFFIPKWVEFLGSDHWLKNDLIEKVKELVKKVHTMKDVTTEIFPEDSKYIRNFHILSVQMENGVVQISIEFEDEYYYQILSDLIGVNIEGEYDLIATLKELAGNRSEYEKIAADCGKSRIDKTRQ